ncbi:3-oxoacyl-ACP synthase III family protein [Nocardia transvalensis]|uniref:3-oxoacyl-ACP synthase III family protein n=1 Tax=Nocardia transvalensis TaxID=37333 RepID=UPI0018954C76|nr:3-oxoacyl-[acyl-carrier-protein] synthase III C-terminal domain-containing protein [Nocardia transvalensis]MBF6329917.1 ketoacyl-ACP synthase III [Nocardia transvalensis]
MPSTTDRHVSVLSTGAHVPGEPIDNARLARLCGPLPEEVADGIQVRSRYWIADPETGSHRTGTSAMAVAAAQQALDRAAVDPDEVDLLIMSTASPEYPLPAAVTYVQEQLGLPHCAAMEFRAACAGFVQGVDYARRLLADGTYDTAVVIGAESISPLLVPVYLGKDPQRVRMRDRLCLYTFGDGAGAVVLRADAQHPPPRKPGLHVFATQCLGGQRRPGMRIVGGGTDLPAAEQARRKRLVEIELDVAGTATVGPQVFHTALRDMLARTGLAISDIDACVLPEGNAEYFAEGFDAAGISGADQAALQKCLVENLSDVGATGAAAVALALDAGWVSGRIRPGATVLLLGVEASRYVYAGLTLEWEAPTPPRAERHG